MHKEQVVNIAPLLEGVSIDMSPSSDITVSVATLAQQRALGWPSVMNLTLNLGEPSDNLLACLSFLTGPAPSCPMTTTFVLGQIAALADSVVPTFLQNPRLPRGDTISTTVFVFKSPRPLQVTRPGSPAPAPKQSAPIPAPVPNDFRNGKWTNMETSQIDSIFMRIDTVEERMETVEVRADASDAKIEAVDAKVDANHALSEAKHAKTDDRITTLESVVNVMTEHYARDAKWQFSSDKLSVSNSDAEGDYTLLPGGERIYEDFQQGLRLKLRPGSGPNSEVATQECKLDDEWHFGNLFYLVQVPK